MHANTWVGILLLWAFLGPKKTDQTSSSLKFGCNA